MKLSITTALVCALLTSLGWAEESVYTNAKGLATKPGLGRSIEAFPDVNKVPPSHSGVVPIPYPNVGSSSDTQNSSREVKVESGKLQIKNKRSFRKEAEPVKGPVRDNKVANGTAYFSPYDFDVKSEVDRQSYYLQLPARNQP